MRPRPTLATLLLTTLLLAGCSSPPTPAPPPGNPPGLTARGIGTVNSTPDRLTVVLGVQNRGRGRPADQPALGLPHPGPDDRPGHRV
jgi:hypothetical protein